MVGATIRRARQAKGWSQEALAAAAAISRRHISQIERGRANASFEVLTKIARALDLSTIDVTGRSQAAANRGTESLRDRIDDVVARLAELRTLVDDEVIEDSVRAVDADDRRYTDLLAAIDDFPAEHRAPWLELLTAPLHDEPSQIPLGPSFRVLSSVRRMLDAARILAEQNPTRALTLTTMAIELAADVNDPATRFAAKQLEALAHRERAYDLMILGRELEALSALERAAQLYAVSSRSAFDIATVEMVRGGVLTRLQRLDEAVEVYRRAADTFARFDETRQVLKCRIGEAIVLQHLQRYREAAEVWRSCEAAAVALHDEDLLGVISHGLGSALRVVGELEEAERQLTRAAALSARFGFAVRSLLIEWSIVLLDVARGDLRSALPRMEELHARFETAGQMQTACLSMLQIVEVKLTLGEHRGIEAVCRDLVERFSAAGKPLAAINALAYLKEAALAKKLEPPMVVRVREYLETFLAAEA